MTVSLTLTLTEAEYRRLTAIAVAKNTNARYVAAHIIRLAMNPGEKPLPSPEIKKGQKLASFHIGRIAELNRDGFNDIQIAARTGISRETVRRYRIQLKLPRRGWHQARIERQAS